MLGFIQNALIYVVPWLMVLTLIVTVHELGHFLAAKSFNVAIDRFSIGFGRALASWRDKSGVEWRIGWIPLGGYVRFAGDENAASVPDHDDLDTLRREIVSREGEAAVARYFHFKPLWQRAIVVAAGPVSNFVLSIFLFAVLLMTFGAQVLPAKVLAVTPGGAAEAAGFRQGDLVVEADGHRITTFEDLQQIVQVRGGVATSFVVERAGVRTALEATPRWETVSNKIAGEQRIGRLGLAPYQRREDFVSVRYNPVEAVAGGVRETWQTLQMSVYALGRIIQGQISADQLHGPLGIARLSGNLAKASAEDAPSVGSAVLFGGGNLLKLAAVISVGIGFMNLLPVPVLDGGHLLFYAYEAAIRRPVAAKVQAAGYRVGLALVLGLMLFATWNDLQQLRVFKILGGLFS